MSKFISISALVLAVVLALTGCFNQDDAHSPSEHGEGHAGQQAESAFDESSAMSSPWVASKNTTRINTNDVFEAAVLISRTLWMATSDDNRPGGVILVDVKDWKTALVSANLIHHPNDGPVLFVNEQGIPDSTLNELQRLKPKGVTQNNGTQVILVGDMAPTIADQVKELGLKTDQISGDNPAAVAKAIDAYYTRVTKENPMSVIIGSMDSEEYTMPAVNWIAHMPEPLLYVRKDEVPAETIAALQTRDGKATIYILGPESAVSSEVEKQLGEYGKVVRISGKDPYDNAIAFARYKDPITEFGWGITTPGHNFSFVNKDSTLLAIAAAPFSHLGKHAPLLWTAQDKMPESVMSYLMSVQPKYKSSPVEGPYNHAWLVGSDEKLSAAAQGEIDSMLEIVSESGAGHGGHGDSNSSDGGASSMPGMHH